MEKHSCFNDITIVAVYKRLHRYTLVLTYVRPLRKVVSLKKKNDTNYKAIYIALSTIVYIYIYIYKGEKPSVCLSACHADNSPESAYIRLI